MSEKLRYYNEQFPITYRLWFETLYKDKYHYMGDADLMSAALLLDVGSYFMGLVVPVYRNPEREFLHFPFEGAPGRWFAAAHEILQSAACQAGAASPCHRLLRQA